MTAFRKRCRDTRSSRDEQGSILLVLLVLVFISIVAVTVMESAFGQLDLSSTSTTRDDTLQAALSGVQAAVSDIRASSSGGYVDPTSLPCSITSGATNTSGSPTYSASIQYYAETVSGTYSAITCVTGQGPQVTAGGSYLAEAVISSCSPADDCPASGTPAQTALWRRVVSTYKFETTNANVPGGVIYSYQDQECLLAQLASPGNPSAGVTLDVTNSCSSGNPSYSLEQFQYTSTWNLAIVIENSLYCIQDPEDLSAPAASPVNLVACASNSTTPAEQWGVNDLAGIEGVATSGSPSGQPNNWCLENPLGSVSIPAGTTESAAAIVTSCSNQTGFSPNLSWQMSPSVGAGGAATSSGSLTGATEQMVNYEQFGLCMDVTNQDVNYGNLIDYDCKQFPDTSDYPVWNQRWCFDDLGTSNGNPVGLLYTPDGQTSCTNPSNPYCVQSPGSTAAQSSTAWVTVVSCTLNKSESYYPSDLLWTAWGSNGGTLNNYTWTDYNGNCMEANPNDTVNPGGSTYWSTIQVATCDGSYQQKWNAPATLGASQVSNTHEGTGPTWSLGQP